MSLNDRLVALHAEFPNDMLSPSGRHLRDSVVPYFTTHDDMLFQCLRIALECDARCVEMERRIRESLARLP